MGKGAKTPAQHGNVVDSITSSPIYRLFDPLGLTTPGPELPPAQDYKGLVSQMSDMQHKNLQEQTAANRPNINTPFGSQHWNDDHTEMTSELDPADQARLDAQRGQQMGMYGRANDLMGRDYDVHEKPLDYSSLGALPSGDSARQQAIETAYAQADSRLKPQWDKRAESMKADLANQGLDPGSEAWSTQMGQFGRDRNDAFSSAMNNAIEQGTVAGQAIFNQGLQSHQQGANELQNAAEWDRSGAWHNNAQDLGEMGMLLGHEQGVGSPTMPGFNASGMGQTPDLLGAAQASDQYALGNQKYANGQTADRNNAMGSAAMMAMLALL